MSEDKRYSARPASAWSSATRWTRPSSCPFKTHVRHPLYGKMMNRTNKFKAHDEENACGIGDTVRVMETRPLTKDKHWRLVEIIEKAK